MRLYTSIAIVVTVHMSVLIALQAATKTIQSETVPVMSGMLLPAAPAEIVTVSKSTPAPLKQKKKIESKIKPAATKEAMSRTEKIEPEEDSSNKEAIESGATIEPPRVDATLYNNPAPAYPSISRRLNESGTVLLEVLIDIDGRVAEVKLKQSSGYTRLDKTALRAVKQWRYVAAKKGNKNIAYWYTQPVRFSLKQ